MGFLPALWVFDGSRSVHNYGAVGVQKILRGSPSHLGQLLGDDQRQETHCQVPRGASDPSWAPGSPLQLLGCPWMSPGAAEQSPSHPNLPLFSPFPFLSLHSCPAWLLRAPRARTWDCVWGDTVPWGFVLNGANPAEGSSSRHTCPWPNTGILQGWPRAFAAKL